MPRGAVRGVIAGAGGLIVLQAVVQPNGADAVGGLLGAASNIVRRCLDPKVPAIPDHSKAAAPTGNAAGGGTATVGPNGQPNGGQITPDGKYLPPTDQTTPQPHAPGGGTVQSDAYRVPYLAPVTRNA